MSMTDIGKCNLSIIIPTYNEAENISELILRIEKSLTGVDFEIIIVDDNSPDGTADIAQKLGEEYSNIKVIKRKGKLGLASAVLEGMRLANGKFIAVMDADLQHPPELLPLMLEKAYKGYDLIIASRYIKGGSIEYWSISRRIISFGAIFLAHLLFPKIKNIKDPISGFFMFKREIVKNIHLNPRGFKILLEILVKGNYQSVVEVPYPFRERRKGKSKLNSKEIINYVIHLLKLKMYRLVI
ncbi:MAG: polyprenol monophosphomannose synthase [Fervidicoccaceae archaeon]|nr:polyprenol monophosphomannose synthase [Fervidicoccaceae archaeon]